MDLLKYRPGFVEFKQYASMQRNNDLVEFLLGAGELRKKVADGKNGQELINFSNEFICNQHDEVMNHYKDKKTLTRQPPPGNLTTGRSLRP